MDSDNNYQAGFDKAQIQSLIQKVGEMDSKFDNFDRKLDSISKDVSTVNTTIQVMNNKMDNVEKEKLPDHEKRIRDLEGSDKRWASIAIIVSTIISGAVALGNFLLNHAPIK